MNGRQLFFGSLERGFPRICDMGLHDVIPPGSEVFCLLLTASCWLRTADCELQTGVPFSIQYEYEIAGKSCLLQYTCRRAYL